MALTDRTPWITYSPDEGETTYIPVSAEPEDWRAGQRYADETGVIFVGRGQVRVDRLQDCECPEPVAACPGDEAGGPCVITENVFCWKLEYIGQPGDQGIEGDIDIELEYTPNAPIYRPAIRPSPPDPRQLTIESAVEP